MPGRPHPGGGAARDSKGEQQVFVERAARVSGVDVEQPAIVRPSGRDHHVIDRRRQFSEERLERLGIGGVERDRVRRADVARGAAQPLWIARGEDHVSALDSRTPRRLEADARAAADHDNSLPPQFRGALVHD
jgi:hypothetical protein